MRISDLDNDNLVPSIVVVQTPSTKLQMFLEDKIKRRYGINKDAIIPIETKKDIKKVQEVVGIVPLNSARWFVSVDLSKIYDKELIKCIKDSTTCVFFCNCDKYVTFKKFKEDVGKEQGYCDFYINYLRRPDFIYLYDAFVHSDNKIQKQLLDYIIQSYSGDIEALMDLFIALSHGKVFTNRKDVAEVCGIGGLSTESFIFSIIKPLSGSAKGLKTVMKNKLQAGLELGEALGWKSFYNFLRKNIQSFCELKELMISGVVYKSVRNLPECYDEKTLSRYQKYLWRLKEIPMSRLLRLRQAMGKVVWTSQTDFLNFVYKYYYDEVRLETLQNMKG